MSMYLTVMLINGFFAIGNWLFGMIRYTEGRAPQVNINTLAGVVCTFVFLVMLIAFPGTFWHGS